MGRAAERAGKPALPFYLSDRPLLNKMYDSRIIEEGSTLPGKLSYVFDFLDAQSSP